MDLPCKKAECLVEALLRTLLILAVPHSYRYGRTTRERGRNFGILERWIKEIPNFATQSARNSDMAMRAEANLTLARQAQDTTSNAS